jgi:hypothetical protein
MTQFYKNAVHNVGGLYGFLLTIFLVGGFLGAHYGIFDQDGALEKPCFNENRRAMASMQIPLADSSGPEKDKPATYYMALADGGYKGWLADNTKAADASTDPHTERSMNMKSFVSTVPGINNNPSSDPVLDIWNRDSTEADGFYPALVAGGASAALAPTTHGTDGRVFSLKGPTVTSGCFEVEWAKITPRQLGYTNDPEDKVAGADEEDEGDVQIFGDAARNVAENAKDCRTALEYVYDKGWQLNAHSVAMTGYWAYLIVSLACIAGIKVSKEANNHGLQHFFYWAMMAVLLLYVTFSIIWGVNLNKAGFGSVKSVMDTKEGTQKDLFPNELVGWKGPDEAVCGMHLVYPKDLGNYWESVAATTPLGVDLVWPLADNANPRRSAVGVEYSTTSNTVFDDNTANFGALSNAMSCTGLNEAGEATEECPGSVVRETNTDEVGVDPNAATPGAGWRAGNLGNSDAENLRVQNFGLRHICTAEDYNGLGPPSKACGDIDESITEMQSIRFYTYGPLTLFWSMLIVHFLLLFIAPCVWHHFKGTPSPTGIGRADSGQKWFQMGGIGG